MTDNDYSTKADEIDGEVETEVEQVPDDEIENDDHCMNPETKICNPASELGKLWIEAGRRTGPDVLAPDHPLMTRFQQTLKTYLESQCLKVTEELRELETELRLAQSERETAGVGLYALQQDASLQQQQLERCHSDLQSLAAKRQEAEECAEKARVRRCEAQQNLQWHEGQETTLRADLRKLCQEERTFATWADELRGELTVSQRAAEKDQAQLRALADSKRRQDAFLFNLTAEVASLRDQLAETAGKITVKERERAVAGQAAADANADLEALHAEQRRLSGAWYGVVALLQRRDRAYNAVLKERAALEEGLVGLRRDIEALRGAAREEMDHAETAMMAVTRLEAERDAKQRLSDQLLERRNDLQRRLAETAALVRQTEMEYSTLQQESVQLDRSVGLTQRDLERLLDRKRNLETESLESLSQQLRNDKATQRMRQLAVTMRERTREAALLLVETERATAEVDLAAARTRGALDRNGQVLKALQTEDEMAERELEAARFKLENINKTIAKRTSSGIVLANKLDAIVTKLGGEEMNPLEAKLQAVTADLREREAEVGRTQAFWLRQQTHAVTLTQSRQDQLGRLGQLRKQVMVIDQKNIKLEREVARVRKCTNRLERSLQSLFTRLESADAELAERRGRHARADREALLVSDAFEATLHDAEDTASQLQAEVENLESERDERLAQLLEAQHEQLAWEKKLRVAEQALAHIRSERAADSEMAAMRTEIHRMEVRRGQLARAQERLVQDLEATVHRRAAIVEGAELREDRLKAGGSGAAAQAPTKATLRQRLSDLRARSTRLRREATSLESALTMAQKRRAGLTASARHRREVAAAALHAAADAEARAAERRALRGRRLELLVRLQRRARWLGDARAGIYRPLQRSSGALEGDMKRQSERAAELAAIANAMAAELPELDAPIQRLFGALQLP